MHLEQQHKDMVAALVKPGDAILATLTPLKVRLIHAAMGVAGEIGEIMDATDDENFLEEAGDLLFFIRELREQGELGELTEVPTHVNVNPAYLSGEIVDVVKRVAVYNKPFDTQMRLRLSDAVNALELWLVRKLEWRGQSRTQALEHNLNKLLTGPNARYASGAYSDAQAHARADKSSETQTQAEAHDATHRRIEALRIVWYALGLRTLFDSLSFEGVLASDADVIEAALIFAEDEEAEFTSVQELLLKNRHVLGLFHETIKIAYP